VTRLLKVSAALGGVILLVTIAAVAGASSAGPCTASAAGPVGGVPAGLVPLYESAAAKYGLGPQGPAVLAAINEVESNFGQNLSTSSAGAVGWMQFEPGTWALYGVTTMTSFIASGRWVPSDSVMVAPVRPAIACSSGLSRRPGKPRAGAWAAARRLPPVARAQDLWFCAVGILPLRGPAQRGDA